MTVQPQCKSCLGTDSSLVSSAAPNPASHAAAAITRGHGNVGSLGSVRVIVRCMASVLTGLPLMVTSGLNLPGPNFDGSVGTSTTSTVGPFVSRIGLPSALAKLPSGRTTTRTPSALSSEHPTTL